MEDSACDSISTPNHNNNHNNTHNAVDNSNNSSSIPSSSLSSSSSSAGVNITSNIGNPSSNNHISNHGIGSTNNSLSPSINANIATNTTASSTISTLHTNNNNIGTSHGNDKFVIDMPHVGYLRKKSSVINQWRDRYFILDGAKLAYFIKKSDKEPKVTLMLTRDCLVSEIRCQVTKFHKLFVFRIIWQSSNASNYRSKVYSSYANVPRVMSNFNLVVLMICIYVAGAFTSGLGMLVGMIMLGGIAYNQELSTAALGDVLMYGDDTKNLMLACDTHEEAVAWVQAIEDQIYCLRTGQSLAAARVAAARYTSPSTDSIISGTEEWIRAAKWKFYSNEDGVRVCLFDSARTDAAANTPAQPADSSNGQDCLRIDVGVMGTPVEVLSSLLQMPAPCRTGCISNMRVVEIIDTYTDIVHISLRPIFVYPTWTSPRDFCLKRCWKEGIDGSYILCLDSCLHHDCPRFKDFIRAELHAAYVIATSRDGDEDNSQCLLTLVAKMNPLGWVCQFYENKYISKFLLHVLDIRDHLDAEKFIQPNFDAGIENRKAAPKASGQDTQKEKEPEGSMATIPPPLLSPEVWTDIDASSFKVRGPTYNVDKVKTISAPALFKLMAIDLYEVPEPTQNVCAHPRNRVNMALQRGEKTWVFVMNIMVPGPPFLCFVVYMEGNPELIEQDTPFGRIAKRFFHGNDDEFRNNRFKLIPKVVDGNMIVKMAVKDTPALLGNKLKQYYHKGDNYFEVDVDVGSSSIARNVIGLAIGYSKAIVVDMAICLQGDEENELPEVIIGGCSCIRVDMSKSKKL